MNFKLPNFEHEEDAVKRVRSGNMTVMDPSVLLRPQRVPRNVAIAIAVVVVIAAGVGGYFAWQSIDAVLHGEERKAAAVQEYLDRDVDLGLPKIETLIGLDDASIKQSFVDEGLTIFDVNEETPEDGLDLWKLPGDVSLADAAIAVADGSKMDAASAAKILNGSWRLTCMRGDYTDLRVKYADFTAGDAQSAINAALAHEGWVVDGEIAEGVVLGEAGVDEVGNTYQEGTVTLDSGTYQWRVSTCALEYIYDISGLPESAMYVVVRITA